MVKITFPDGSVKEFAAGTTAYQIAESISPRLAADSLAASVNGATVDLSRPIDEDASVKFYKWEDEEGKHAFWHTSSHLLAEALEALYPGIQVRHRPGHRERLLLRRRSRPMADHRSRPSENRSQDGGAGHVRKSRSSAARCPKAEALKEFTETGRPLQGRTDRRTSKTAPFRTYTQRQHSPTSAAARTCPTRVPSRPSSC